LGAAAAVVVGAARAVLPQVKNVKAKSSRTVPAVVVRYFLKKFLLFEGVHEDVQIEIQ